MKPKTSMTVRNVALRFSVVICIPTRRDRWNDFNLGIAAPNGTRKQKTVPLDGGCQTKRKGMRDGTTLGRKRRERTEE